jgi:hypothetical protein
MNEKKFIYLVQGCRANILKFAHLHSESSDLITLTYDKDINESEVTWLRNIFYPKSTFAEGRNKQLEVALGIGIPYLYYIFLDDDVSLKKGTYKDFENLLVEHEPAVGVPLCDIVKNLDQYNQSLKIQHPIVMDQLVQAYHREVIKDKIVLPFVTDFDNLSWWYSCEINNFLILRYYRGYIMQFNTIEVNNDNHNWNQETKESSIANSFYVGGTNEEGLNQIKKYIVSRFGDQPQLINTLFHPPNIPRIVYLPEFRDSIHRISSHLFTFRMGRLFKILIKILSHCHLSFYYMLFNRLNLINPKKIKSYKVKLSSELVNAKSNT